ncbi:MAG: squalene--hopene cyclase [Planctomycetales bacterium]|nr:squalene--hopene cyclase [Planctomycetales bacterium]
MPLTHERLRAAYETARRDLLAERDAAGYWVGELATSALSTATAVSALSLVLRHATQLPFDRERIVELIRGGVDYLTTHQNPDGGWGDTDKSHSNIATAMLGVAAIHLATQAGATDRPLEAYAETLDRANAYIDAQGRLAGLRRRYGRDKTFAVPILTNAALAGLADWREVSPLPFEAACFPQSFYRFLQLPVVSYAIPALVAIGQARYFHRPPRNPLLRWLRRAAVGRSLEVLRRMQPASGGYLEAVPLTSFVTMSLAATDRADHAVTRDGVRFLVDSVRPDGSWPIDTNLACWNTTLSINALANAEPAESLAELDCLDWVLGCQYHERHPFTGADPGGWGWSDLSGAVPDADDTPGALLAIAHCRRGETLTDADRQRIDRAARMGIRWLLDLQNRDGGWPTFCRGWGKLPFDRSGADLTAHVIRAFAAWRPSLSDADLLKQEIDRAIKRGFRYLQRVQRADGSWYPLWFGNQDHPDEENPVYGTSKVLLAYRDTNRMETSEAQRGLAWLTMAQNGDGGWGGGPSLAENSMVRSVTTGADDDHSIVSSVEETALAVEALLAGGRPNTIEREAEAGIAWLIEAVEAGRHRESWPIGFYFAKLWYYEKLYPQIFTVSALGQACRLLLGADAEVPPSRLSLAHPTNATAR